METEHDFDQLDQAELMRVREGYREMTTVAVEVGAATRYSHARAGVEAVLDERFPGWREESSQ